MRLTEILRLVWLNLAQNKSKVVLTSIGIVAGSATIMLVLAIGMGGQREVAEQFKNLNAGAIDITYNEENAAEGPGGDMPGGGGMGGGGFPGGDMPGGMPAAPGGGMNGPGGRSRVNGAAVSLSETDMEDIALFVPGIADTTISFTTKADVEGGELEESASYTIAGVMENYAEISNLELVAGEFLTEENEEQKEKVCVLGSDAAREIFGSRYNAYNNTLYIDNRPYIVVGVLEEMGTVTSGISPDEAVFVPYASGVKYLTGTNVSPTITVIAEEVDNVKNIIGYIEDVLRENYPNTQFTLSDAGSRMEAASRSNETLQLLLIAMAAIVFLIGGIGIMNVLFVSVKERTNEIGILKAIGCSRRDILTEFLLEASCISLTGAVIGVLLGLGIAPVLESFHVRVELSPAGAVLSLAFGVLTGSLFGFYPAFQASRLVPVVALNHE